MADWVHLMEEETRFNRRCSWDTLVLLRTAWVQWSRPHVEFCQEPLEVAVDGGGGGGGGLDVRWAGLVRAPLWPEVMLVEGEASERWSGGLPGDPKLEVSSAKKDGGRANQGWMLASSIIEYIKIILME